MSQAVQPCVQAWWQILSALRLPANPARLAELLSLWQQPGRVYHQLDHLHSCLRLAQTQATSIGIRLGSQLLGLGDLGNAAASLGAQLLTLQFSRSDETDADLVGLELAARAGYQPDASVSLWQKMGKASGSQQAGLAFLSTHPSGPDRIRELQQNVPKVQGLYQAARKAG